MKQVGFNCVCTRLVVACVHVAVSKWPLVPRLCTVCLLWHLLPSVSVRSFVVVGGCIIYFSSLAAAAAAALHICHLWPAAAFRNEAILSSLLPPPPPRLPRRSDGFSCSSATQRRTRWRTLAVALEEPEPDHAFFLAYYSRKRYSLMVACPLENRRRRGCGAWRNYEIWTSGWTGVPLAQCEFFSSYCPVLYSVDDRELMNLLIVASAGRHGRMRGWWERRMPEQENHVWSSFGLYLHAASP